MVGDEFKGTIQERIVGKAMNSLRIMTIVSALSIYILIVAGGYVSSTGAGLACPDWPLCHGQVIPPLSSAVLAEYTHRVLSLVAGIAVFATAVVAWRRPSKDAVTVWSSLGAGLLLIQILVGAVTVQTELEPAIVTLHLGLAVGVFAAALVTAVLASLGASPSSK